MEPPEKLLLINQIFSFEPISTGVIIALMVMGILLLGSALMSGSEIAFFSLKPPELKLLSEENNNSAKRVILLLENPKKLLSTLLVGHGIANIGLLILSTYVINNSVTVPESGKLWLFFAQGSIMLVIIVLISEVTPKVYANNKAYQIAKRFSLIISALQNIFNPISKLLISTTSFVDKRVKKKSTNISVDELEHALELTYQNKETTSEEQKILKGIVKFGNTEVIQIMTSRMDIISVDLEDTFEEVLSVVQESGYSRIPVFKDKREKVCGILYIKDLLAHLDNPETNWQELIRPPYFVPENKKIVDLLEDFQKKKMHLAIVVDEYGSNRGLITLEDIIEEIVGEIEDEFDDKDLLYSKLDDANYIFEGKTPLVDLYKVLDIGGDEFELAKGESGSIAGFLLEQSGRILKKHEKITFENYTFTVEAADRRRVKRIKLSINPQ